MLKSIERVTPLLTFDIRGVDVRIEAQRQDSPPRLVNLTYALVIDSDETDQRLELLHPNVRKYGTIFNTLAESTGLSGTLTRKA